MWSFINSALYCSHALDIVKTVLEDSVEYGGQNTNFKFKRPSFVDLKKRILNGVKRAGMLSNPP